MKIIDTNGNPLYEANLAEIDLADVDLTNAFLIDVNFTNSYLIRANFTNANLMRANFTNSNLAQATFVNSCLENVDFICTNLLGADFTNANLARAKLTFACLEGANLTKVKNIPRSPLHILRSQQGVLTAYKCLTKEMLSPCQGFIYELGKEYIIKDGNPDERSLCGKGMHVATLDWYFAEYRYNIENFNFVKVFFKAEDILAIPFSSDGEFRIKKGILDTKILSQEELKEYINFGLVE